MQVGDDFDDAFLEPLTRLTQLEELKLDLEGKRASRKRTVAPKFSPSSLAAVLASSWLRTLELSGNNLDKSTNVHPPAGLKSIWIKGGDLDADEIAWTGSVVELETLKITSAKLTDDALEYAGRLSELHTLDLSSTKGFGDKGLGYLVSLSKLRNLHFWNPDITDVGAKTLSKMISLVNLTLRSASVTDTGVRWLFVLSNLTSLDLTNAESITHNMLQDLLSFHALASVTLTNAPKITCKSVRKLRERISELDTELVIVRTVQGRD